jgi:hypothetical protein
MINMKTMSVSIKGVTPLLFNKFAEAEIDSPVKKRAGAIKEKPVEDKLYLTDNNKIYTPSTHLVGAIVNDSKQFKIQGKGKSTYSKVIGSTVQIEPFQIVHNIQKWDVFSISAVNPMTRGRVMLKRPKMDEWKLEFGLIYDDEQIPEETMKNILDYAGTNVGIGDWRPDKKGRFGKFIVERFEEVA